MKLSVTILAITTGCLLLTSCHETDDRLKFKNSGDSVLYGAIASTDDLLNFAHQMYNGGTDPKSRSTEKVIPNTIMTIIEKPSWDYYFERYRGKDSMRIFVISEKNWRNNTWEEISNKKLYKKTTFTLEQIEAVGWEIDLDSINSL